MAQTAHVEAEAERAPRLRLEPPYPELPAGPAGRVRLRWRAPAGEGGDGAGAGLAAPGELFEGQIAALERGLPRPELRSPAERALAVALRALSGPPGPLRFRDLTWEFGRRTYTMGVVNVTPDSFSGDGVGDDPGSALERARQLVSEGADAIDLGGESTRPGHRPVALEQELRRVLPALERMRGRLSVPIFIDTSKAEVARRALELGADAINDVWGLRRDPAMAGVVAAAGVPVVCMHNQEGHQYRDLMAELERGLRRSLELAAAAGIPESDVVLDPGIGFGKVRGQNFEVLRRLPELRLLGRPLLLGTSRKSLIGWLLDDRPVEGRLLGTAATVAWSVAAGADVVRVHDVAAIRDVVRVTDALARGLPS